MTTAQKMVMTLYNKEILLQVEKQFNEEINIVSIEIYGILFRLFKADAGNINLEISTKIQTNNNEEIDLPIIGKGNLQKFIRFFKPIGFYTKNNEIEITILKEFEEEYDFLINNNQINSNVITHRLTLIENALLASFSADTFTYAFKALNELKINGMTSRFMPEYDMVIPAPMLYDKKFIANGLNSELIMSLDGSPQFYVDDKYGIDGPFMSFSMEAGTLSYAAYLYKELFQKFKQMNLLSSFKTW